MPYPEIGINLRKWVEQKEFLTEGITILTLCTKLKTNRTYLFCYINSTYNCSFRDYISKLRIDEAKRLLKEEASKDIHEIAAITGFSSTSNFYRSFKKHEEKTPSTYRENLEL